VWKSDKGGVLVDGDHQELAALLQCVERFVMWLSEHRDLWNEVEPHLIVVMSASRVPDVTLWMQGYRSAMVLQAVAIQAGMPDMAEMFGRRARCFVNWLQMAGMGMN
jgi:hypothetical protein